MRKRKISLLLCAALALTLAACAPAGEEPDLSPSPTPPSPAASEPALSTPVPEPTPSPEPPAPPLPAEYGVPDRDYRPWQAAYMEFLTLLQTVKTTYEPGGRGEEVGSESYSLYDVDKDGVPELFVKFGSCEADYFARCYTVYTDPLGKDVAVMAAQFPFGHSALYTCPDKNGFLRSEGHMGYHEIYEYGPLEDGSVPPEQEIFREEDVREYTPVDEIVPGAQYIEYFYTRRGAQDNSFFTGKPPYALGNALLLPVADWYDGPAATGNSSEAARTAILAALNGETEVYGASGDHFYGDTGPVTWAEYIQPHGAYPYNNEPLEIWAHAWQDMNGDGQEECLLELRGPESGDSSVPYIVVLSEQGGTVYAYFFGFYGEAELRADGTITNTYGGTVRLSFWRDQCYEYAVPDTSAPAVKWVEGAPAG